MVRNPTNPSSRLRPRLSRSPAVGTPPPRRTRVELVEERAATPNEIRQEARTLPPKPGVILSHHLTFTPTSSVLFLCFGWMNSYFVGYFIIEMVLFCLLVSGALHIVFAEMGGQISRRDVECGVSDRHCIRHDGHIESECCTEWLNVSDCQVILVADLSVEQACPSARVRCRCVQGVNVVAVSDSLTRYLRASYRRYASSRGVFNDLDHNTYGWSCDDHTGGRGSC